MRFLSFLVFSTLVAITVQSTHADEDEESKESAPLSYFSLKPSFVTNVQGAAEYIRCDIQLMTQKPENLADIQLHSPALRHTILFLLGDQQGKSLQSKNGQEKLRKILLKAVQQIMSEMTGETKIDDLFFTFYVVQ